MGVTSGIEWTHATWNPHYGCRKVSAGCKNCYAEREMIKYGKEFGDVKRAAAGTFNSPLTWLRRWNDGERDPKKALMPGSRIFTCSWSDWFIEDADSYRDDEWAIVRATPEYIYLILTKRPERILDHLPTDWGYGYQNVWLGVSAENQQQAQNRIPMLLEVPAKTRFVSAEPLLGMIDFDLEMRVPGGAYGYNSLSGKHFPFTLEPRYGPKIDWVITGGESGYSPRVCDLDWARVIRDQCQQAGTPLFHKQNGGTRKVDGAWGGRILDGRTWDEFPL